MEPRKRPLVVSQDILPLSSFKAHASAVLNSVKGGRSIVITQNGKPACVLVAPEEFDRLREREVFVTAVDEGREDVKAGRVRETRAVVNELERRYGKAR